MSAAAERAFLGDLHTDWPVSPGDPWPRLVAEFPYVLPPDQDMTDAQRRWADRALAVAPYRALAWWLRELVESGRGRFDYNDPWNEAQQASLVALRDLGLLRVHRYASGAWQYEITPQTRAWYRHVIATPVPAAELVEYRWM